MTLPPPFPLCLVLRTLRGVRGLGVDRPCLQKSQFCISTSRCLSQLRFVETWLLCVGGGESRTLRQVYIEYSRYSSEVTEPSHKQHRVLGIRSETE